MVRIGFIGAGNMAQAMIKGILEKGVTDSQGMLCSDKDVEKIKYAEKEFKIKALQDNKELVKNSDVVFLAVKPQVIDLVLEEIKESIDDSKIIISIAAGVKINRIEEIVGDKKIVRVMPNTPCLVGKMTGGFTPNSRLSEQEISTIEIILNSSGKLFRLEETLLDSVTGLSGSGPAFVARMIEAFMEAGVENGLPEEIAYELSLRTFEGTSRLLSDKKLKPEKLIDMVSSPNGTTVAGREILEKSDLKGVIKKTIARATQRSKELGERK